MDEVYLHQIDVAMNLLADRCRAYRAENAELIRTVERLESQYGVARNELDELRREYCQMAATVGKTTPAEIARRRGWDCFWNLSEDNNG
jgi:predicted nuclease with TOPRIM domain